jgi:PD-(D/E)XK nuclease superfamily
VKNPSLVPSVDPARHVKALLGEVSAHRPSRQALNLWSLLNSFQENSYSRLLAFLLDSTRDHGLGNKFFRTWMSTIQKGSKMRLTERRVYQTRAYPEWPADNDRRLDVLVKGYSPDGKELLFVVGIENKLDTDESAAQLSDYQTAIDKQFPRVPYSILIFLSPDGRSGQTSSQKSRCKCCEMAYSTLARACATSTTRDRAVRTLVKHLGVFVGGSMLGGNVDEAKRLNNLIISKPEYSRAAQYIRRYGTTTTIRNLMYEEVLPRLTSVIGEAWIDWHWPKESSRPREFNFRFNTTRVITIQGYRHSVYFMLNARTYEPDKGDSFTVYVMMHGDDKTTPERIKTAAKRYRDRLVLRLPANKMPRWDSGKWVCLWAGEHYQLADLRERKGDGQSLADLIIDAHKNTKQVLGRP